MPARRFLVAFLALAGCTAAGCTASRPDAVDVPAAPAEERRAEAVAPVVRVVAGRADTLLVADLLGPGVEAAWCESPDVTAVDAGGGRVAVTARDGLSGLVLVPYTADGGDACGRALVVEVAVEPVVTFRYSLAPGRPAPQSVHVIGGFNDWSRTADPLVPDGRGGLAAQRAIAPGRYEYKLVVDGAEVLDPASRDSTLNPFGAYNNVLTVSNAAPGRLRLGPPALADDPTTLRFALAREDADGSPAPSGEVTALVLVDNAPVDARHVAVTADAVSVDLGALPAGLHRLRVAATGGGLASRWVEVLMLDGQPLGAAQAARDAGALGATPTDQPFVWQDAVVYQVVLDRFRNGDRTNDRPVVADSLLPPANYAGGDLQGLLDAIEAGYFTDLAVNTLWLSPVYDNPPGAEREFPEPHRLYTGYHGYWPSRPRAVDEHLGDMALLKRTVSAAHARGLRVLLDVVAHHVHDSHPYFSEHPDWFGRLDLPDGSLNLRRWDEYRLTTWFEPYLPSFDFTASDDAVRQVADDAVWWLRETGADGFRHDAVKHVPNAFWRALTARVADENARRAVPVYQIGETFGSYGLVSSYVVPGQLDAQFNFLLYDAAVAALGRGASMQLLADEMDRSLTVYGPLHVMGNLLDSHDKVRFMAVADGDVPPGTNDLELGWGPDAPRVDDAGSYRKMELGIAYLMTTPGVPVVYYGDEIGMTGAGDPDNRRPMPWADLGDPVGSAETALRDAASRLVALRGRLPALRHGAFETLQASETLWVYRRTSPDSDVVVALNSARTPADVRLPGLDAGGALDALDASAPVSGTQGVAFSVPAGGYRVVTLR